MPVRRQRLSAPAALAWTLLFVASTLVILPQAGATTGGPDSCGYQYIDSTDPGGPTYAWDEISATGTPASSADDSPVSGIPIGFSFDFCGTPYTSVSLAPNGYICFNPADFCDSFSPTPAPCGAGCDPSDYFAAFWSDLFAPDCFGPCTFYQTIGTTPNRIFIYEEQNIEYYSGPCVAGTFEMKLFEGSGVMEAHYQSTSPDTCGCNDSMSGIQDVGGSDGLTWNYVSCGMAATNLAVRYFMNAGPPVANDDACSTLEDVATTVAACDVLANDSDPDGDPLTVTGVGAVSPAGIGTAAVAPGGTGVIFTPSADQNAITAGGPATFTYTITDGMSSTAATVTVDVTPVNDAPTFAGGLDVDYNQDYPLYQLPGWATGVSVGPATATDEAAQTLSFPIISESNPGLFSGPGGVPPQLDRTVSATSTTPSPGLGAFGMLSFQPATGQSGSDDVCFQALDSGPGAAPDVNVSPSQCLTITIHACGPGMTPVAYDQSLSTVEDTPVPVTLYANGGDCSLLNIAPTSLTTPKGSLTLVTGVSPSNPFPLYTYTPNPNENGLDSFPFTAWDASLTSAPATVTIDIIPVDDIPIVADDAYIAYTWWTLTVPVSTGVLANDLEVDGQTLTATLITPPVNIASPGDFALAADGSFTYKPIGGYAGPDMFTYRASDGLLTADAVALITVMPNAPPVAAFVMSANPANTNQQVSFTDQSYDSDGTIVSHFWEFGDGYTSTEINPMHSYATTGMYPVHLTVVDNVGNVSAVTHMLEVKDTPNAVVTGTVGDGGIAVPVAYAGEDMTVLEGTQVTLQGSGQGNGELKYAWHQESGPNVVLADRTTPTPSFAAPLLGTDGPDTPIEFSLRVATTDTSLPDFVTVIVQAKNHSPKVDAGSTFTVVKGGTGTLDASATTDPDGDALSYAWTQVAGGHVTITDASMAKASFAVPEDMGDGTLLFQLAVSDGTVTVQSSVMAVLLPPGSDRPQISFTATRLANGDFSFAAVPDGLDYSWEFGDGGVGTGGQVEHHYAAPGTYRVKLSGSLGSVSADAYVQSVTVPASRAESVTPSAGGADPWPWILGGAALLVVAAAVAGIVLLRKRR